MTPISEDQSQTQMSTGGPSLTRQSLAELQARLPDGYDSDCNSAPSIFSHDPDPTSSDSLCVEYSDNGDARPVGPPQPVQPPVVQNGSINARSYLPDTPNISAVWSRRAWTGGQRPEDDETQATYPAHDTVRILGGWGFRA
jgi:hypothetical protein